jgi:hypothetical protein
MRDDDIPSLVRDVWDLGLVGLNVLEVKRLFSRLALAVPETRWPDRLL